MSHDPHILDVVARRFGGRETMASALGVTMAAIGNWKARGVPVQRCVVIERLTQGAVTRRDLRPDDWRDIWPELIESETKQHPALATQAPAAINNDLQEVVHG